MSGVGAAGAGNLALFWTSPRPNGLKVVSLGGRCCRGSSWPWRYSLPSPLACLELGNCGQSLSSCHSCNTCRTSGSPRVARVLHRCTSCCYTVSGVYLESVTRHRTSLCAVVGGHDPGGRGCGSGPGHGLSWDASKGPCFIRVPDHVVVLLLDRHPSTMMLSVWHLCRTWPSTRCCKLGVLSSAVTCTT